MLYVYLVLDFKTIVYSKSIKSIAFMFALKKTTKSPQLISFSYSRTAVLFEKIIKLQASTYTLF
jgi:hypothetical protein